MMNAATLPVIIAGVEARSKKRTEIVRHCNVQDPFLFLHVNLLDIRSEFSAPLEVTLRKEGDDYVGEVYGAVAIANTIAYIAALAPNALDRGGRWNNEQGGETPWLKVRVDGKEGWVRAEEDLNALGLFQAG